MVCRGLIWHDSGRIEGRPFAKFFNYGEPDAPELKPSTQVIAFDKLDGSLGISYMTPDGPAIATKASFASEQALHATELLRGKYGSWCPPEGHTALFEIIYPENRIVLDYGDEDKLVMLGMVNNKTGRSWGWEGLTVIDPPFELAEVLGTGELQEVLKKPDRPNREGMVLKVMSKDIRIKVKQQEYLELHKVMTGLNERQIWEWMRTGVWIDDMLKDLPEELHDWTREVYNRLLTQYQTCLDKMTMAYCDLIELKDDRKAFAKAAQVYDPLTRACLFLYLDNHSSRIYEAIWKAVRP
jgi:RNA ligase